MEKLLKEKYPKGTKVYHYVGIAFDEPKRITEEENLLYPIYEWQIIEKEVEEILIDREFHNPLYNHFPRTGCYLCPKQNLKSLFKLWKFYPLEWAEMKELEEHYKSIGAAITEIRNHTIKDLEIKFAKLEEAGKEPENNREDDLEIGCFCK